MMKSWIFFCCCLVHFASGETFEECEGAAEGAFVASSKNCATYIYCAGEDSASDNCGDGLYFDSESQSCDEKENVVCLLDADETEPEAEAFAECEGVADNTFVASAQDCQAYIYCNAAESSSGSCEEGFYFDSVSGMCDDKDKVKCPLDEVNEPEPEEPPVVSTATPATPPTELSSTTMETWTVPTVVKATCPNSDDPSQVTLLANSESCSDYYLCYHGHAIEMRCANQLHFNVNTGLCDYPENVQCAINRPNANKCLPHITDFFPHPAKCNYYYYCIKGYLTVQQCPFYYGWDIERRSCVQITQAKCFGASKRN